MEARESSQLQEWSSIFQNS